MSNRFTRVPDGDPPGLPWGMRPVVAIADAFMVTMASRPARGSLRRTWITPATLWLAAGTLVLFLVSLWLVVARLDGALRVVAGIGVLWMVVGSAAVAAVGVAQRRGQSPHTPSQSKV